ncbi:MAG: DUF1007 family protein [Pseudomonadota bacterium]
MPLSQRLTARVARSFLPSVLAFLGLLLLQVVFAAPASAHPHAWIDLRSTVVLDDQGRAVALEQEWLFDDFYTVVATQASGGTDWTALAAENLKSLRAHDYFTEVKADERKISLGTVGEFSSELRNGRLWMRFLVPFAEAVDPTRVKFSYSIFDPSYYIEILHMKGDLVAFAGRTSSGCSGQIVAPTPSTDMVMLAQALDRNAKADNALGRVFAERVNVSCR